MNNVIPYVLVKTPVAACMLQDIKRWSFGGLAMVFTLSVLTGCTTPEVKELQGTINKQKARINNLEEKVNYEKGEKEYHQQRESALEREKRARIRETAKTSHAVRIFTEKVLRSVQRAAGDVQALDYLGYEIIDRRKLVDKTKNVLLVDMKHTVPVDGQFIGARAYIRGASARLRFCLFRAVDNGFRVVAVSEVVSTDKNGAAEWSFSHPIIAREGDYIGLFAYDGMPIPYDDVGTGNVAYITQGSGIETGDQIAIAAPVGRYTKAFSFGMIGYYE